MVSEEELAEIAERNKTAPGRWHPDGCGAPVVHLGYCEKLLNMLPKTDLYMRRKKNERPEDELARCVKINEQLKPLFEPAYQAHQDVTVLLEEVKRLQENENVLRVMVTMLETFWNGDGMDHDPVLRRMQALVEKAKSLLKVSTNNAE